MPDMLEVVAAKETQAKVSEIDYRKYLHEWTCLPDLQINLHARKVNDQLSDVSAGFHFISHPIETYEDQQEICLHISKKKPSSANVEFQKEIGCTFEMESNCRSRY